MDADQLDLKITGHVVTPGRVLEDGWIGVRGEIVAGLGPAAPTARQVIDARGQWILPGAVDAQAHCFSEPAGRPYLRLPSHAANQMAKIAPIGMLFVTSHDGRSHCPEKWTEPDDIAVCLAAPTAAVIRLDEELAPGLRP